MKPRLPSAILTREDTQVWLRINLPLRRPALRPLVIVGYQAADRRDADLMFKAQNHPIVTGHYIERGERILVRGRNGNRAAAYAYGAEYST